MSWHADIELLHRYRDGTLTQSAAWSLETHVSRCAPCRTLVVPPDREPGLATAPAGSAVVDPERLAVLWRGVAEATEVPPATLVERALRLTGVPDHVGRLLGATPALSRPWLLAVALVVAAAVAAAWQVEETASGGLPRAALLPFLTIAPLVPLASVAMSYGPTVDPMHEFEVATPVSGLRLVLLRTVAVVVVSLAIVAVGGAMLPAWWVAAAWLLPALAVVSAALALSTYVNPLTAAAIAAGVWTSAVLLAGAGQTRDVLSAFHTRGQLICLAVAVTASALVALRHDALGRLR